MVSEGASIPSIFWKAQLTPNIFSSLIVHFFDYVQTSSFHPLNCGYNSMFRFTQSSEERRILMNYNIMVHYYHSSTVRSRIVSLSLCLVYASSLISRIYTYVEEIKLCDDDMSLRLYTVTTRPSLLLSDKIDNSRWWCPERSPWWPTRSMWMDRQMIPEWMGKEFFSYFFCSDYECRVLAYYETVDCANKGRHRLWILTWRR